MLKIVVVGESGVGKTSIIRRFIHGSFDPESRPTIGANFFQKSFMIQNSEINLQFWDTTGQERLRASFDIYLKGAAGAIIVEDHNSIRNPEQLKKLREWRDMIFAKTSLSDGRPIPVVFILNKCDLPLAPVVREETTEDTSQQLQPVVNVENKMSIPTIVDSNQERSETSRCNSVEGDMAKHQIDEESKGDCPSETPSQFDLLEELQEQLKVNAAYRTSAKDGKKIKVAIASLVRLILKESSYIQRVEDRSASQNYADLSQSKEEYKKDYQPNEMIYTSGEQSELLQPNIVPEGGSRRNTKQAITLQKQFNGPQGKGGACCKKGSCA